MKQVRIYTDGGCSGNPGPGGYGAVLLYGEHRKEIFGGFKRTTNNRMEIFACIVALDILKYQCDVTLYSDSKYVVNSIEKGWAERWRKNNWQKDRLNKAKNADLWEKLLSLCDKHKVKFNWVKGHAGNRENERCDTLVGKGRTASALPEDHEYEKSIEISAKTTTV